MRALFTACLLLLPSLAHAQGGRSELVAASRARAVDGARLHFAHAIELMQDGYFEEACPWLDRALLVVDSPALRWNAAVCRNELGDRASVIAHLRVFLLDAGEDHPHFEEAFAWVRRLAPWPDASPPEPRVEAAPPTFAPPPAVAAPPAPAPVPSPREVAQAALVDPLPVAESSGGDDVWVWLGVIGGALVVVGAAVILTLTLTPGNDLDLPVTPQARIETR